MVEAALRDRQYINVIATSYVKAGHRDEYLKHFNAIRPKVLQQDGCLEYGATVDVESNLSALTGAPREDVVVIIEKWASLEHLYAHLSAPHMKEFFDAVKDLRGEKEMGLQITRCV